MGNAEYLRKYASECVPFAVVELVIANVVVGNFTMAFAADLLGMMGKRYARQQQLPGM